MSPVVYGIDVGCVHLGAGEQPLAATTFAWARIDHWPEVVPPDHIDQRDIRRLAASLTND
jgi:hypothetical protein